MVEPEFLESNLPEPFTKYRIISIDDSYHDTGAVHLKVQAIGLNKTYDLKVTELYQKAWLDCFSKEDVAHIAALYAAQHTNNLGLIKRFPSLNPGTKASVIMVGVVFSAFLILSNLAGFKLASIGSLTFPAGLIFFPITYVFDNILTEVYGFKISRRIIWAALAANLIVFVGAWITTYLNPSPLWNDQAAYEVVYRATPRIFVASMISYLMGEFVNSIILAKLKVMTAGRHLWMRALASTAAGVGIDTVIFTHVAFLFLVPYSVIWKIIATMYLFKLLYEACAIPITYKISNYLKRKDNVDYFDFKTKFNPFSLEIE